MQKFIVTFAGSADVMAETEDEAVQKAEAILFGDDGAHNEFQLMSVESE